MVKIVHLSDPPFTIGRTRTDKDGKWKLDGPLPPGPTERIKIVVKKTKDCKGDKLKGQVGDFLEEGAAPG